MNEILFEDFVKLSRPWWNFEFAVKKEETFCIF